MMADDPEKAGSAFDFLYVDHDRIGLLLAQFDPNGVLTEIVSQAEEVATSDRGLDFKLVKLGTKEEGKASLGKRFNTRWLIPLLFLDKAQGRFNRDWLTAPLGSLVVADGILNLLNTEQLQDLYRSDALKTVAMRRARATAENAGQEFDPEVAAIELEAISRMPAQIQANLYKQDMPRIWGTLRGEGLTTPASELSLKHGNIVAGDWTIVGLLDVRANDPGGSEETDKLLAGRLEGQQFLQEALHINGILRRAYGRPDDAYGVTPLIIFRAIA